jgi:hypothetical protein
MNNKTHVLGTSFDPPKQSAPIGQGWHSPNFSPAIRLYLPLGQTWQLPLPVSNRSPNLHFMHLVLPFCIAVQV